MTPERRDKLTKVLNRRQANLTVVLENVFDPHNISAVMRTCDAVGVQDIYVLNTLIPPHKKWGIRSSSSASKWISVHQYADVNTCVNDLRKKFDKIITTAFSRDAQSLYQTDLTSSLAIVFGNEKDGVSEQMRSLSDADMIIPQMGIIQSLNISVACAVALYEAFRQKQLAGHYHNNSLPPQQRRQLEQEWGLSEND